MKGSNEQEQGATPSGSGCQPSGPQPASQSSQSGIPSAAEFYGAIEALIDKLRFPDRVSSVERAHAINSAIDLLERTDAAGGPSNTYPVFTDGMQAAAEICGTLAETTYDDSDGFAAATGCEAAIMQVVRAQRREQRNSAKATGGAA